jgi:hypothetical protein
MRARTRNCVLAVRNNSSAVDRAVATRVVTTGCRVSTGDGIGG